MLLQGRIRRCCLGIDKGIGNKRGAKDDGSSVRERVEGGPIVSSTFCTMTTGGKMWFEDNSYNAYIRSIQLLYTGYNFLFMCIQSCIMCILFQYNANTNLALIRLFWSWPLRHWTVFTSQSFVSSSKTIRILPDTGDLFFSAILGTVISVTYTGVHKKSPNK